MMTDNPLTVAADTIRKYGWIQRQPGDEEVGFCLLGALGHALRAVPDIETKSRALKCLGQVCDDIYDLSLASYINDRCITSADEAIQLLEKASARFDEAVA